jgi:hypothetical protein
MIPNASAGVNPLNGKKNPVTLVAAVVIRNIAVQLSSRFSANSPNTTTNPEKIPIKLNTTCTKVKVVIPKIMMHLPSFWDFSMLPDAICCVALDSPADFSYYEPLTTSDKNHVRRSVSSIQFSIKLAVATSFCFWASFGPKA